ncbi:MAG TPA: hypothetical protein VIR60_06535, partial [Gammaproteobacteria bacterium]
MRNSSVSLLLSALLLLMPALPVHAALINGDWQTAGDGLMVRDTTTSLEWLKLTETAGLSYLTVSGQLGVGGT